MITVLHDLRRLALESDPLGGPVCSRDVRRAIASFPDRAARGSDHWEAPLLKKLPDEACNSLAGLINEWEENVLWPGQMMAMMVSLLIKPSGADRPITLVPIMGRLWGRVRKGVFRSWNQRCSGHWDVATVGNSALRSCLTRVLRHEIAAEVGSEVADIYWDVEKFYDDICLLYLGRAAIKRGYPPRALVMALMLYLAPRFLSQL
eukprot:10422097-Alexandrium_andersonii.AAC.1